MRQSRFFGSPGTLSDARDGLLVRILDFSHVYYNNGNSSPFFSIPLIWGNFDQVVRPAKGSCVVSHLPTSENRAVATILFGNVHAFHWINAALLHCNGARRRHIQPAFAIHVQII